MKTCKDCCHYKICQSLDADYSEYYIKTVLFDGCDVTDLCKDFADLSEYVKPPVKIGQKVWRIKNRDFREICKKTVEMTVSEISQKTIRGVPTWGFIANGTRYRFDSIGKTVFLSEESAKKSLY